MFELCWPLDLTLHRKLGNESAELGSFIEAVSTPPSSSDDEDLELEAATPKKPTKKTRPQSPTYFKCLSLQTAPMPCTPQMLGPKTNHSR